MNLRTITFAAISAAFAVTGCGQNGPLNSELLGNMVGGQAGHLVKAGGHLANANAMSEKDEDTLGQSVGVALTNRYGLYDNQNLLEYVTMVGLTVASTSPKPNGNYVFGILKTNEVNAFSGPNGYVFITYGLLMQLKDEAELAGVLGHEIAHVCNHDGLHQVQAAETRSAASEALRSASGEAAQYAATLGMGVDVLTKQAYTQPQEHDADKLGVQIMAAAGYDPQSYRRFLQRLQAKEGSAAGARLMSTHPGVASRVQRVSQQTAAIKPGGVRLAPRFTSTLQK
ncbi:MAG: M48 family metalloprotease [Planctomycetota bacterium]|nr:M48 family metalloprotease [Planctomycetota bacterium]